MTATTPPAPGLPELAAAMTRLTAILDRETLLLAAPAGAELLAIQDEKTRLTQLYAGAAAGLHARPGALDEMAPALGSELRQAALRLAGAVERNQRKLRAMTEAADRVVAAMVRAIKEQRGADLVYAPTRGFAGRRSAASGVTVDRRL
jgi:hypothetical protein